MQIFAAINISLPQLVEPKITASYPNDNLKLNHNTWLIAASGETTKNVCENIGIGTDNPVASGVVVLVNSWWGRADKPIWEWLAAKERANGG